MTTYWLLSRQDFREVNDSMVCEWPAKRKGKKKKKKPVRANSMTSSITSSMNGSVTSIPSRLPAPNDGGIEPAALSTAIDAVGVGATLDEIVPSSNLNKDVESSTGNYVEEGGGGGRTITSNTRNELRTVSEVPEVVSEAVNKGTNSPVADARFGFSTPRLSPSPILSPFRGGNELGFVTDTKSSTKATVRAMSTPALRENIQRALSPSSDVTNRYPSEPNLHNSTRASQSARGIRKQSAIHLPPSSTSVQAVGESFVINMPLDTSTSGPIEYDVDTNYSYPMPVVE